MYVRLAEKYKYTPQEIADMTYGQQIMLLKGKSTVTFDTMQEFLTWMSMR